MTPVHQALCFSGLWISTNTNKKSNFMPNLFIKMQFWDRFNLMGP